MTAIDFGKEFLQALYYDRDVEKTASFLAGDLIWVTPEEVLHLKSNKAIRDYVAQSIASDQQPYNVDIAAIKSAPAVGDTNTVVYEVNLIPRREQDAFFIRCSLSIHSNRNQYELTFVGMSREYERSGQEQMRGFMENLPGGLIVLAGFGGDTIRELYVNSYFSKKLGIEEGEFYDCSDENPFFMLTEADQKRMTMLINDLSRIGKIQTVTTRATLQTEGGDLIPCQVTASAAYKDQDGSRTILYLLFSDMTETLRDLERDHKRELAKASEQSLADMDDRIRELGVEAIREKEKAEKLQEEARGQIEEAAQRIEDAGVLIKAAQAAAQQSESDARETERAAKEQIAAIQEAAKKELEEATLKAKEEGEAAGNARAAAAEEEAKAAREKLESLESAKAESDKQYEDRILKLEQELHRTKENMEKELADEKEKLRVEVETRVQDVEERAAQREKKLAEEAAEAKAEQEGNKQGYLLQIERLRAQIEDREAGIEHTAAEARMQGKEKDKAIDRLIWLLQGQGDNAKTLAESMLTEHDRGRQQNIARRLAHAADDIPEIAADMKGLSMIDASYRAQEEVPFTLSSCFNMVRKVVRPQCREKEIVFSCETDGSVPNEVIGSKAGLQLAFLAILENAVVNTPKGGKIVLTAHAKPPVHGRAYFHFLITDTGSGIAGDKLPALFDEPLSELAIARDVISAMGGSISVRNSEAGGAVFEVSVNLKLGQ